MTSRHADVVIVGGDLNTEPGDLAYRIIIHTADLKDAFDQAEKRTPAVSSTVHKSINCVRSANLECIP